MTLSVHDEDDKDSAPTVRLPAEWGASRVEALHELAWRDLLDLVPGAAQALADMAAAQAGTTAAGLALNTEVRFSGGCRSDLFLACRECDRDRAVIEIKGPANGRLNPSQMKVDAWQTDIYRDEYRANPALACEHLPGIAPLFILLDAGNRSRQAIEQKESARVGIPLSLDGWAVLTYEEVLSRAPFKDLPLAQWLLACLYTCWASPGSRPRPGQRNWPANSPPT